MEETPPVRTPTRGIWSDIPSLYGWRSSCAASSTGAGCDDWPSDLRPIREPRRESAIEPHPRKVGALRLLLLRCSAVSHTRRWLLLSLSGLADRNAAQTSIRCRWSDPVTSSGISPGLPLRRCPRTIQEEGLLCDDGRRTPRPLTWPATSSRASGWRVPRMPRRSPRTSASRTISDPRLGPRYRQCSTPRRSPGTWGIEGSSRSL
jgi:hypothetical protein